MKTQNVLEHSHLPQAGVLWDDELEWKCTYAPHSE